MNEKPELKDGHTKIANEILDALAKTYLSSYESQFLWFLFRKTYGWNQKDDRISVSQIVNGTGIHKSHVSRTKKKLLSRKIVTQTGNKIGFNKYWSQWLELPKQVTFKIVTQTGNTPPPKQATSVTQTGNKKLPKQADTNINQIDTITKDTKTNTSSPSVKGPHPGVQAIIDTMQECFGELDDTMAKNRQYAWNLLRKAKMETAPCLFLIRAAAKHEWWGTKITKVSDIYKNAHKIANAIREKKSKVVFIS